MKLLKRRCCILVVAVCVFAGLHGCGYWSKSPNFVSNGSHTKVPNGGPLFGAGKGFIAKSAQFYGIATGDKLDLSAESLDYNWDLNNDGIISVDELRTGMQRVMDTRHVDSLEELYQSTPLTEDELSLVFSIVDGRARAMMRDAVLRDCYHGSSNRGNGFPMFNEALKRLRGMHYQIDQLLENLRAELKKAGQNSWTLHRHADGSMKFSIEGVASKKVVFPHQHRGLVLSYPGTGVVLRPSEDDNEGFILDSDGDGVITEDDFNQALDYVKIDRTNLCRQTGRSEADLRSVFNNVGDRDKHQLFSALMHDSNDKQTSFSYFSQVVDRKAR